MKLTGHSQPIAAKNAEFFAANASYSSRVAHLDTYRHIRRAVDRELRGVTRLLDIGNGGVFDYDTRVVERIVAVDLFLDRLPSDAFPPNVTARRGDALALDEPPGAYDGVLYALVLHHLVGSTPADLVTNVRRTLAEARRVMATGGKLIVVESCAPGWFYDVQRSLFPALALLAATPAMRHPPTLHLPLEMLLKLVAEHFSLRRADRIPVGRWILQFGRRWPTALTPVRPFILVASK